MIELIQKLVEAWGPSGYEHHVREIIRAEVASLADEITVDPLGNLICRVGQGGPKVMIASHMDEIGVMANYAEPNSGYLRFTNIGGVLATTLMGHRVRFENGVTGVIGAPDIEAIDGAGVRMEVVDIDHPAQFVEDAVDARHVKANRPGAGAVIAIGHRVIGVGDCTQRSRAIAQLAR